jgi:hypothetical protein
MPDGYVAPVILRRTHFEVLVHERIESLWGLLRFRRRARLLDLTRPYFYALSQDDFYALSQDGEMCLRQGRSFRKRLPLTSVAQHERRTRFVELGLARL